MTMMTVATKLVFWVSIPEDTNAEKREWRKTDDIATENGLVIDDDSHGDPTNSLPNRRTSDDLGKPDTNVYSSACLVF
ncbi:unnamed protein product [Linum trigynum]|uniref:Uncharacterized protein n=1 Tax=Linum trigynum TaxID=586398 RepID=A0AAV2FB18_9ROSI